MRYFFALIFLLSACSEEKEPNPWLPDGVYAGADRDRLCVKEEGAAFIVYGKGGTNCSAGGRIVANDERFTLAPRGDGECRIPMTIGNDQVTLGDGGSACAYYCGPGAVLTGKTFKYDPKASPAVDFAGDPLC